MIITAFITVDDRRTLHYEYLQYRQLVLRVENTSEGWCYTKLKEAFDNLRITEIEHREDFLRACAEIMFSVELGLEIVSVAKEHFAITTGVSHGDSDDSIVKRVT